MKVLECVKSQDPAEKCVVQYDDGLVGEVTFLDYPTKSVVCVPTETACVQGCKFCFLSNEKGLKYRNLDRAEMVELVQQAVQNRWTRQAPLLISFMGAGEPLFNFPNVARAMDSLSEEYFGLPVRFALSTSLPKSADIVFLDLIEEVVRMRLPLKVHLSLHFTNDEQRRRYMPNATDIKKSLALLETYKEITGQPVEVHYTAIAGLNDTAADAGALAKLVAPRGIPVKVLHYSENPAMGASKSSDRVGLFVWGLEHGGATAEFYKPYGLDVGSSCGQFDLSRYVRAE